MLTKLIEKSGRKDWLFMKDCYIKLQGGARIIEEVEALISQGMNIFTCLSSKKAEVASIPFVMKSRLNQ